ncbi:MAG: hypothetical protein MUO60_06280 [Clostridiaceae bacterium]|nr:hypothetical protein [Clostridiaceae bacterium]
MAKKKNEYLDYQRDRVEKSNIIENAIEQLENIVPTFIRTDGLYEEKSDIASKKR